MNILMNVLGTSTSDIVQAGERYEQSYECVGNAAWKHIVEMHIQLTIRHTPSCIKLTFDTQNALYLHCDLHNSLYVYIYIAKGASALQCPHIIYIHKFNDHRSRVQATRVRILPW